MAIRQIRVLLSRMIGNVRVWGLGCQQTLAVRPRFPQMKQIGRPSKDLWFWSGVPRPKRWLELVDQCISFADDLHYVVHCNWSGRWWRGCRFARRHFRFGRDSWQAYDLPLWPAYDPFCPSLGPVPILLFWRGFLLLRSCLVAGAVHTLLGQGSIPEWSSWRFPSSGYWFPC